jgi:hypothetical protein
MGAVLSLGTLIALYGGNVAWQTACGVDDCCVCRRLVFFFDFFQHYSFHLFVQLLLLLVWC